MQCGPGYSLSAALGAAASLGSPPRSPNLLFPSEPPERLGGEICGNVAYHSGGAGARGSALRPVRRAVRAPGASAARCRASSVLWSLELEASVRVVLKRVRLEVPEPNLSFLPIRAISNLHARSFLYRLILVWQEKKKNCSHLTCTLSWPAVVSSFG